MDLYTHVSRLAAQIIIRQYSTSFGLASSLFGAAQRHAVGDIYALVRIADEIVDTYGGIDAAEELLQLEQRVNHALETGYSSDIVVHAFAATAREYGIGRELTSPFFTSMRMDVSAPTSFSRKQYESYIYGSAEVVGLMCLKVFVHSKESYNMLASSAQALGSAFQKVNFLRDMSDDYLRLNRFYFPIQTFDSFDTATRDSIVHEIDTELGRAKEGCRQLPRSSQYAVALALKYFSALNHKLSKTPAESLKHQRTRINNGYKIWLLVALFAKRQLRLPAV